MSSFYWLICSYMYCSALALKSRERSERLSLSYVCSSINFSDAHISRRIFIARIEVRTCYKTVWWLIVVERWAYCWAFQSIKRGRGTWELCACVENLHIVFLASCFYHWKHSQRWCLGIKADGSLIYNKIVFSKWGWWLKVFYCKRIILKIEPWKSYVVGCPPEKNMIRYHAISLNISWMLLYSRSSPWFVICCFYNRTGGIA